MPKEKKNWSSFKRCQRVPVQAYWGDESFYVRVPDDVDVNDKAALKE